MDVTSVTTLIGSLGFPIFTTVALFWYMVTEQKELRLIIQNNTAVLTRILEHIKEQGDVDDGK